MKYYLYILLGILFSCASPEQNSQKSQETEAQGWSEFSNEQFEIAEKTFLESLELDSTNSSVKIGIAYCRAALNKPEYFKLITEATNNSDKNWAYGMISSLINKNYNEDTSILTTNHLTLELIAAPFSNTPFIEYYSNGNIKLKGQYLNESPTGIWEYYRENNLPLRFEEYIQTDRIHETKFDNNGNKVSESTFLRNIKGHTLITQTIYYQQLPDKPNKYLFVSKEGFTIYENGKKTNLDSNTPDNLITEEIDSAFNHKLFIYTNGKKKPYIPR